MEKKEAFIPFKHEVKVEQQNNFFSLLNPIIEYQKIEELEAPLNNQNKDNIISEENPVNAAKRGWIVLSKEGECYMSLVLDRENYVVAIKTKTSGHYTFIIICENQGNNKVKQTQYNLNYVRINTTTGEVFVDINNGCDENSNVKNRGRPVMNETNWGCIMELNVRQMKALIKFLKSKNVKIDPKNCTLYSTRKKGAKLRKMINSNNYIVQRYNIELLNEEDEFIKARKKLKKNRLNLNEIMKNFNFKNNNIQNSPNPNEESVILSYFFMQENTDKIEKIKKKISLETLFRICKSASFEEFIKLVNYLYENGNIQEILDLEKSKITPSLLSNICRQPVFIDFEKLVNYLSKYETKNKIEQIQTLLGLEFFSLSTICRAKGFKDFEKLVNLLYKTKNKIEEIQTSLGIQFSSLATICYREGFEGFEKLVEFLSKYKTENKIKEIKTSLGVEFSSLATICRGKGFEDLEKLVDLLCNPETKNKIKQTQRSLKIEFTLFAKICRQRGVGSFRELLSMSIEEIAKFLNPKIDNASEKDDSMDEEEYVSVKEEE